MSRQADFSITSTEAPEVFLARLKDAAAQLPPGGRLHPEHVTGIEVVLTPPRFTIQCTRDYREAFGPVCEGRVAPNDTGTVVHVAIRRSRAYLAAPAIALPLILYNVIRGTLSIGTLAVCLAALLVMIGLTVLFSLLSSDKHEAEADALTALVRRAALPRSGEYAGA